MSRGPGRIQRSIAGLIAAEPDGAWSYEDLAVQTYGAATRASLSAVGRAIAGMTLPGTWRAARAGVSDRRR
jgi:hypothetical protein